MATGQAMYFKIPADGKDSQSRTGFCTAKVCIAVLGGSCLVLLSIMAISACSPMLSSTGTTQAATTLLGLPSSLRTQPQTLGNRLPGASPWKDLALAGIQDANRCGTNANAVKSVLANMNSKDKAIFARAERAVVARATPNDILKGVGATAPFGYWDPAGFSTGLPEGRLLFYREVELKHGRVCMLAALGILVAEKFHPLFPEAGDLPAYIQFQNTPLETFWIVVALAISLPEVLYSIPTFADPAGDPTAAKFETFQMKTDRIPGDLGFDPLGLKPKGEKEFMELQNKEINNGRLAMIATAGMIGQELATGQKIFG